MGNLVKVLFFFLLTTHLWSKELTIGSKAFSESIILSEMLAQVLEENYNYKINRKMNLGGTKVLFDALDGGDIDLYPDYTGTGYIMLLKMQGETDPQAVYDIVKKEYENRFGITWSPSLGFNNTYAIAVRENDPRFKEIKTISDIIPIANKLRFVAAHESMERKDGYKAFKEFYKIPFDDNKAKGVDSGLMYSAIRDDHADMIMSYSTDGRIKAYNLKILEDDKKFFPPYYAAFLVKEKTLEDHPALVEIFELFDDFISEEEMIEMNDLVDRAKREPKNIAHNFLVQKGIIKGKIKKPQLSKGFIAYTLSKKNYLLKITKEHLLLSFGALFLALLVSIPTGVALTRFPKLSKLVFPIINTVQTIPSLALLGFLIPLMGIGYLPAVIALFLYSLLPLIRNTYSGIEGVNSNYIEASRGLGLTPMQILFKVEIPLAMPIILAGVRTASVIVIGTATLAALVGAGGLGEPIFRGVATVNGNLILLGAIPSAILAIVVDKFWEVLEKKLVSPGIRL